MPAERMEIIFETAERHPGQIAFDVSIRNERYIKHRNAGTAERTKIAFDIEMTAKRLGYDFISGKMDVDGEMIPVQRFMSSYPHAAANPRPIVNAFRDQGYDVVCRGGYSNGRILTMDELRGMSRQEHDRDTRDEAAYVAGRLAERAGRNAASIQRLQAAALAEEAAAETAQMLQSMKEAIRSLQAQIPEEEIGLEVPEEEAAIGFAA